MAKYRVKRGFLSVLLTFVVVFGLLLSGPASAVTVTIGGLDSSYVEGSADTLTVTVDLDKNTDLRVPFDGVVVSFGSEQCEFDMNGVAINASTACSNAFGSKISVNKSSSNYGYGVGTGYGYGLRGTTTSYDHDTFSVGYGYGAGSVNEHIVFTINFTAPSVSTDTSYDFKVAMLVKDDSVYYLSDSNTVTITAQSSGGSRSHKDDDATGTEDDYDPVTGTEEEEIVEDLGLEGDDVELVERYEEFATERDEMTVADLESAIAVETSPAVKKVFEKMLDNIDEGILKETPLFKQLDVYKVTNKDGSSSFKTRVRIDFRGLEGVVTLVEVIPKSYAKDVADIIFSHPPEILERDPVVRWVVDTNNVDEITYVLDGKKSTNEVATTTYAVTNSKNVIDSNTAEGEGSSVTETTSGDDKSVSSEDVDGASANDINKNQSRSSLSVIFWTLLVIAVVVILSILIVKSKK